jgi:decaprenylphospho-beta-D-ribofuranose 2-oxidase
MDAADKADGDKTIFSMFSQPPRPFHAQLAGWGRCPVVEGLVVKSEDLPAAAAGASLTRGLGRSYGDSSLPARPDIPVADATPADRLLAFDSRSGVLRAEAGLSLLELNRLFLSRGWFTPVTPGTQFVTLGGMVAADVHGKNHHVDGCFGRHVSELRMLVADGRTIDCSAEQNADLFRATIGGMGLTGHILEVEFTMRRVPSPWIWGESRRIADLDAMISGLKEAAGLWPMTVGWIDCLARGRKLGRGILMQGRWATEDEAPRKPPREKHRLRVPLDFPGFALCKPGMKLFNLAYYWKHLPRVRAGVVHPQKFFYPLDALDDWNRIYGRRGFVQYQCVLPHAADNGPARRFLEAFVAGGGLGFLCVIKDCGAEGEGLLSFPRPGISIAIDFPFRPTATQDLIDRLNRLVIAEGGRIYLAKDALTRAEHFRAMEPRVEAFNQVRRTWDPEVRIRSAQSVRLLGDPP